MVKETSGKEVKDAKGERERVSHSQISICFW